MQPAGGRSHQLSPVAPGHWLTDHFLGCASAVRRDAFLAVGGFDSSLFMQGEEPDLCAKLLLRGMVTTLGHADPGIHHVSPKRQNELIVRYATRNQMLIALRYGTGWALALQLLARSLFSAGRAWRSGYPRAVLAGARTASRSGARRRSGIPSRRPLPAADAARSRAPQWHPPHPAGGRRRPVAATPHRPSPGTAAEVAAQAEATPDPEPPPASAASSPATSAPTS